jgi:four helix bundle protein
MYEYSFERLDVWKRSIDLSKLIYKISSDFPEIEKFGLISQIRRASISIAANLEEGSSRQTNKEKARFYEISYGSLMEVLNFSILSHELEFIDTGSYTKMRVLVDEIANKVNALVRSTRNKK